MASVTVLARGVGDAGKDVLRKKATAGWAALLVVWVVWGSTYLGIRVAVESMPPLLMAGTRYLVAGLIMLPMAVRRGWPSRAQWAGVVIVGTLMLGAQGALAYAEQTVPSGLAALLIATVPLWLLGLDVVVNRARLGLVQVAGLVVGLAGVGLLSQASGSASAVDVILCLFVAATWAIGTILSRRISMPTSPVLSSSLQMLTACVLVFAVAAGTGEFGAFHPAAVPAKAWVALVYLTLIGTIVGFTAYGIAVRNLPTATVSTYAYVNPVVAVLLGTVLLNERLTTSMLVGGALVVGAVFMVVRRRPSTAAPSTRED
jgi:drug/metabolite transporter (DMT)-like permease